MEDLLGPAGLQAPLVATFHSACVRILRQHGRHIGLPDHFTIYDEDDRQALVKECMKEGELADRTFTPGAAVHRISYLKNQMTSLADALRDARGPWEKKAALVYSRYEKRLRETGAVDFDDLLLLVVRLFSEHPAVLAYYRNLWRCVLVDEYQDTNRAQYRIVRALTQEHGNICVVGDGDQSVYRWRGADIRNILDFEDDFPDAEVIKLEQNYRSTQTILSAANAMIENNRSQKPKHLWTDAGDGDPITLRELEDEHAEARYVAGEIERLVDAGGSRDEVAVFYRANAQSRVLEDTLVRYGVGYQVIGGTRFYERREIKDLLAYLRLVLNPFDSISLERVLNVPPRRIGEARPLDCTPVL